MKSTLFVLASFITCFLFAQDIPEDRIIDWSQAGLHRPLNYSSVLNIDEFESFVESNGSYSIAVNEAIKSLAAKGGGVLKFNSKEYFFTQTINVPSNIVLSGISSRETIFKFNLAGKGACISFKGKVNGKALTFIKEAKFQSKEIYVSGDIAPNTYAFVRYKDKSVLESSWAYNHFGQLVFNTGQIMGLNSLNRPYACQFLICLLLMFNRLNPLLIPELKTSLFSDQISLPKRLPMFYLIMLQIVS